MYRKREKLCTKPEKLIYIYYTCIMPVEVPCMSGIHISHRTEQNRYSICYSLGSFIDPSIIFSRIPAGGPLRTNVYFNNKILPNTILLLIN